MKYSILLAAAAIQPAVYARPAESDGALQPSRPAKEAAKEIAASNPTPLASKKDEPTPAEVKESKPAKEVRDMSQPDGCSDSTDKKPTVPDSQRPSQTEAVNATASEKGQKQPGTERPQWVREYESNINAICEKYESTDACEKQVVACDQTLNEQPRFQQLSNDKKKEGKEAFFYCMAANAPKFPFNYREAEKALMDKELEKLGKDLSDTKPGSNTIASSDLQKQPVDTPADPSSEGGQIT